MKNQIHNNKKINFVVISNICLEPHLRRCLEETYGNEISLTSIQLAEFHDNIHCETLRSADYIIILINIEARFPNLTDGVRSNVFSIDEIVGIVEVECRNIVEYLKDITSAPIFWYSFEDYGIQERDLFGATPYLNALVGNLNKVLFSLKTDNITFLDLGYIIAQIGTKNSYDIRGKYRWNAPYSKQLISNMVAELDRQTRMVSGNTKKCVVVDCDNVLWGGIISEDGIDGIKLGTSGLGQEYYDLQRYLKILYDYGIILAVCSKNDSYDVIRVFHEHSAMLLKEDHISCFRINWKDKAENIRSIADELNIGLDSIVFVDDSDFEVRSIRALIPEVTAILYDRNTVIADLAKYINLNDKASYQSTQNRQITYLTNRKRMELRTKCASFEEYLDSLEMKIDILVSDDSELSRISELSLRANQCTNGTRYSVNDLKNYLIDDGNLYSVYVKDKYSDLGLVGAIGIKDTCLNLFILSCRALGRKVEEEMLAFTKKFHVHEVIISDTGKNKMLVDHLLSLDMKLILTK